MVAPSFHIHLEFDLDSQDFDKQSLLGMAAVSSPSRHFVAVRLAILCHMVVQMWEFRRHFPDSADAPY